MASRGARRRAFRSGARECILVASTGICVIAGLLWALEQPASAPAKACQHSASTDIGGCFSHSLRDALLPYVKGMGVGLLTGVAIALFVIRFAVPRKADVRPVTAPVPSRSAGEGRWIVARFGGRCAVCSGSIVPGDRVLHRSRHTVCRTCGAGAIVEPTSAVAG
jgi:hypothetical protein